MSQTDSSMPEKFGCLKVNVCCQIVSSSEMLWLFFLFFFQFSAVHCAVHMQQTHDLDID